MRTAPLTQDGGCLVVIAGVGHRHWIEDQIGILGLSAVCILEPEARDSAAAMAAAAAWICTRDPEGIAAFVASDHHIPDAETFQSAVRQSAIAATQDRIVTLGVIPVAASSAYGYIKPVTSGLSAVDAFVEKPDVVTAHRYVADGYLWNSGNFIVKASVLMNELKLYAPDVVSAAQKALPTSSNERTIVLSNAFLSAPKVSIDYALMEKTKRASVLPVDFAWSDLGAWDSVAEAGSGNSGLVVLEDSSGCLVRATDGMAVAAVGVSNLAIIVEPDAVLVCDLSRAQEIKSIVTQLKTISPAHLDLPRNPLASFSDRVADFDRWIWMNALPVWATLGVDEDGSFKEALTLGGIAPELPRRARVQARQSYVFAQAGLLGWSGPWKTLFRVGMTRFSENYRRSDGLFRSVVAPRGEQSSDDFSIYDQAFTLLALAYAKTTDMDPSAEAKAVSLRDILLARRLPQSGFQESGDHPYQANCHMHLLEACLAWEDAGGDNVWRDMSDSLARLAMERFIDADRGFLREFFDETWSPAPGLEGSITEPGHQFEWSWLLERYARSREDETAARAARGLYRAGRSGVHERLRLAVDTRDCETGELSDRARLWPQTEWLKAALILGETATGDDQTGYQSDALDALTALQKYLEPTGLWRDKLLNDGTFIDEPAPASSFYHIMAAYSQIQASSAATHFMESSRIAKDGTI